jgi:hypothetical protein
MEQKNYGPYTPQETDRIATELKGLGVPFEINKDEEEEKKFSRNDFSNIVTRAEYRTESYLAQIFYFVIEAKDEKTFEQILIRQKLAPKETGPETEESLNEVSAQEEALIKSGAELQNIKKRWTARFLVAFIALPILIILILQFYHRI